jgi:hypothetical protein
MNPLPHGPLPPSHSLKLLQQIIGKRLVTLRRYSPWPKEETASRPDEDYKDILPREVFSFTHGPLVLEFEGAPVISIIGNEETNSVEVCEDSFFPLSNEEDGFFLVDATDPEYSDPFFASFIGQTLVNLTILKFIDMPYKPSEVGLCFIFESGKRFIATLHMSDGSNGNTFAIMSDHQIPQSVRADLQEMKIAGLVPAVD